MAGLEAILAIPQWSFGLQKRNPFVEDNNFRVFEITGMREIGQLLLGPVK